MTDRAALAARLTELAARDFCRAGAWSDPRGGEDISGDLEQAAAALLAAPSEDTESVRLSDAELTRHIRSYCDGRQAPSAALLAAPEREALARALYACEWRNVPTACRWDELLRRDADPWYGRADFVLARLAGGDRG